MSSIPLIGQYVPGPEDFEPVAGGPSPKLGGWMKEHEADLTALSENGHAILAMADLAPVELSAADFDRITSAELKAKVARQNSENPAGDGALRRLESGGQDRMTFGFQTRYGDVGIMQVVGETNHPLGVRMRYKFVREASHLGAPFTGRMTFGQIELLGLADAASPGAGAWLADGSRFEGDFPGSSGLKAPPGKVLRDIAFRISIPAGPASGPVLLLASGTGATLVGSTAGGHGASGMVATATMACPPEAKAIDFRVGVAAAYWRSSLLILNKPTVAAPVASSRLPGPGGPWEASVEMPSANEREVTLLFHYSLKSDFANRMAAEISNGHGCDTMALEESPSSGPGGMVNSVVKIPAAEYSRIKEFVLQRRRYEWVEFRNVSLHPGARNSVESINATAGPTDEDVLAPNSPPTLQAGSRPPSFGPVTEKEINLFDSESPTIAANTYIGFDSGRVASTPQAVMTLDSQSPVVVETFPISGARDVEPGELEIRVRFSKPMTDGAWSWCNLPDFPIPTFPGEPHYEADGRTCVVKARIEPGRAYAIWLNTPVFQNFSDREHHPALPYLQTFKSKGQPAATH